MKFYTINNGNLYVHFLLAISIYIIVIFLALYDCKKKYEEYTDKHGNKHHFQFYPYMDSLGNNSYKKPKLKKDIEKLKKVCENDPKCYGFNTNTWFKKGISSQDQWFKWTKDKNKGLYLKLPGVRRDSIYPNSLYPGSHKM